MKTEFFPPRPPRFEKHCAKNLFTPEKTHLYYTQIYYTHFSFVKFCLIPVKSRSHQTPWFFYVFFFFFFLNQTQVSLFGEPRLFYSEVSIDVMWHVSVVTVQFVQKRRHINIVWRVKNEEISGKMFWTGWEAENQMLVEHLDEVKSHCLHTQNQWHGPDRRISLAVTKVLPLTVLTNQATTITGVSYSIFQCKKKNFWRCMCVEITSYFIYVKCLSLYGKPWRMWKKDLHGIHWKTVHGAILMEIQMRIANMMTRRLKIEDMMLWGNRLAALKVLRLLGSSFYNGTKWRKRTL